MIGIVVGTGSADGQTRPHEVFIDQMVEQCPYIPGTARRGLIQLVRTDLGDQVLDHSERAVTIIQNGLRCRRRGGLEHPGRVNPCDSASGLDFTCA